VTSLPNLDDIQRKKCFQVEREFRPSVGTGVDPGFTPRVHQQTLATGPFGNTCEADAVSPKAAYEGVAG
jgi:hypothetical protein